jgi:hypothetical protein
MRKYDKSGCKDTVRTVFTELVFLMQYGSFFKDLNVFGNISDSGRIGRYGVYIQKEYNQFLKLSTI